MRILIYMPVGKVKFGTTQNKTFDTLITGCHYQRKF